MWLIPILCLVILAFAAVWFGFIPPPNAETLVRVREGTVWVSRGQLQPHAKQDVAEILCEAEVSKGFIAVTSTNRVIFSRHIPAAVRQRLRNVILNQ